MKRRPLLRPYTATTLRDGRRHRALVMRADGSHAYEGRPLFHRTRALSEAQRYAAQLNAP